MAFRTQAEKTLWGPFPSDSVITGQHTNVVVYKAENKKKSCSLFHGGSVSLHIFTGREIVFEKCCAFQLKEGIKHQLEKVVIVSDREKVIHMKST